VKNRNVEQMEGGENREEIISVGVTEGDGREVGWGHK